MSDIRVLGSGEWDTLRDVRLAALKESPDKFLATYERESGYGAQKWRDEFQRGEWNVGTLDGELVSLLGIIRDPSAPSDECFLGYMWVAPYCRGLGIASRMLEAVIGRLRESGVRTAFLWVLDGNDAAVRLYERAGFVRTHRREPLPERPGRSEELLRLDLT